MSRSLPRGKRKLAALCTQQQHHVLTNFSGPRTHHSLHAPPSQSSHLSLPPPLLCPAVRHFSAAASPSPSTPTLSPLLRAAHPPGSPLHRYVRCLQSGELRPDIRQEATMQKLQALWQRVEAWDGGARTTPAPAAAASSADDSGHDSSDSSGSGGVFSFARRLSGLLGSRSSSSPSAPAAASASPSWSPSGSCPRGLYMHGGVGSGKTMMMNILYDSLSSAHKTRDHFHHFMLGVHQQLHQLRAAGQQGTEPLAAIAASYAQQTRILCLDEFQVTDVADAMILRTLFSSLWQRGLVLVATSNRPPADLYKNGINREVFLPFIAELQAHCDVQALEDGQDHRLLGTVDVGVYHYPLDAEAERRMEEIFRSLSLNEKPAPASVTVMMGRTVRVPLASKQAALFSFSDLCEQPLGAADYIAIAARFQYVLVKGIPLLRSDQREKIRRFITLLDVLYEHGTRLIVSAAARPRELFVDEDGRPVRAGGGAAAVYDEGFASGRAVSRLIEMQSSEYVKRHHEMHEPSNADA